jgi:hypothetical protein
MNLDDLAGLSVGVSICGSIRGKRARTRPRSADAGFRSEHWLPHDAGPVSVSFGTDSATFQPELDFRDCSEDSKVEAFVTFMI